MMWLLPSQDPLHFPAARTTPVKGSPGTQLQGSSIREQSMQVLQGCKSADLGGEILALKRALQQEKDRVSLNPELPAVCANHKELAHPMFVPVWTQLGTQSQNPSTKNPHSCVSRWPERPTPGRHLTQCSTCKVEGRMPTPSKHSVSLSAISGLVSLHRTGRNGDTHGESGAHVRHHDHDLTGPGGSLLDLKPLCKLLRIGCPQADCAEEDIAQLLQAMKGAELVVERQTSLGMEGIGKIFDAANHLVSAEMLHHLQLIKAQGLGSLQVFTPFILFSPSPRPLNSRTHLYNSRKDDNNAGQALWQPDAANGHSLLRATQEIHACDCISVCRARLT